MKLYKILFTTVFFIQFCQNVFANPIKVYVAEDLSPSEDDPWQKNRVIKTLPDDFKERLYTKNKDSFKNKEDFEASLNMLEKREDRKVEQIGDFVYYPFHQIGKGEEGTVYLAQHIPTGQYVTVKKSHNKEEYKAFKNIERLIACYKDDENNIPYYYIFTPLIISRTIEDYCEWVEEKGIITFKNIGIVVKEETINNTTVKTLSYNDLEHSLALMKAVIREEKFLMRKGAEYQQNKSDDKFVIVDADGKPEVIFVDLKPSPKYEQRSECHLLFLFRDLLGLKRFLQGDGSLRKDTIAPKFLITFINEFSEHRHNASYTLKKAKDLLQRLEKDFLKFKQNP